MSSSASSNSSQTIANVVFGVTATIIGIVTVWQGHRLWKMWRENAHDPENMAPDIELGLQSFRPTPTSPEAPEREVAASSASSANQVGEVAAESDQMPMFAQRPELQPTLPTTIDAETSRSPTLGQGAHFEGSELPRVHTGNAQPALTDMEH